MAIKKQELIDGCFAKAGDDEPLFVLRATDKLAPALVREWARQFATHCQVGFRLKEEWHSKYKAALDVADAMEAWPQRKMPD